MKIQYDIAIHLMRWLTNFYDFRFKWKTTETICIHSTKAWFSQLVNFKNAIWHFRRMICNKIVLNFEKYHRKLWNASDCFEASCINWASVFEWHKRFKEGRESVRDDERCGRSKEVKSAQWHFHQDNAPVHNSILVTDYLSEDGHEDSVPPQLSSRPCSLWLLVFP